MFIAAADGGGKAVLLLLLPDLSLYMERCCCCCCCAEEEDGSPPLTAESADGRPPDDDGTPLPATLTTGVVGLLLPELGWRSTDGRRRTGLALLVVLALVLLLPVPRCCWGWWWSWWWSWWCRPTADGCDWLLLLLLAPPLLLILLLLSPGLLFDEFGPPVSFERLFGLLPDSFMSSSGGDSLLLVGRTPVVGICDGVGRPAGACGVSGASGRGGGGAGGAGGGTAVFPFALLLLLLLLVLPLEGGRRCCCSKAVMDCAACRRRRPTDPTD